MLSSHRFCDYCGTANRLQARFCHSCGSPMQLANASSAAGGKHTVASTNTGSTTNILPDLTQNASPTNGPSTGGLAPQTLLAQRYRILKLIGQGGMGAVYQAEDLRFSGALRAVKELSQQGLSPQEAQEAIRAFKYEADLLARLIHPHLPRIYDHFDEQGRWYLTMDYIAGETLEQRLGQFPNYTMPPQDVLNIALQLCDTLHYLHSQKPPIIFRDLKPANIMLTTDDHIYLIDFGIARLFKPGQASDTAALGSPGYAAPEQYGKTQTTPSADIYSLGATLYQLLSGCDPSLSPFQFPPLNLPSLPGGSELETLIQQMVKVKKEKRPANMLEVKQRLQTCLLLLQGQTTPVTTPPPPPVVAALPTSAAAQSQAPSNNASNAPKTIIVDQAGTGDYRTFSEAIEELHASSGLTLGKLLVHPGIYHEQVILDLPIEIRGVGASDDIILENTDDSCLIVRADNVSIHGLTFRSYVKQNLDDFYTVNILQGQPLLEQCVSTGEARACINLCGNTTNATLRHCKIYGGRKNGIRVNKAARVTIEDCEIHNNTSTQISIRECANASIYRSKIYAGGDCGIITHKNGEGIVEDCEIFENALHGITVISAGQLHLKRCVIRANKDGGIASLEQGQGTIEQCDIFDNARLGIAITSRGKLDASDCKIHDNGSAGIHIYEHGQGIFTNCDIYHNATLGIAVKQDGHPHFLNCSIHNNCNAGITIVENGSGTFEDCQIYANAKLGVGISDQARPVLRRCKIQRNEDTGIYIYQGGQGTIEDCDISSNRRLGIMVSGQSNPLILSCEIHHNNDGGVHVRQDGRGTFVSCDIHTNQLANVAISTGGNPSLRSCKLYASLQDGVYVYDNGRGLVEQCDIFNNSLSGVEIKTGASPTIRTCQIYNNRQYGIDAHDNGQGIVERCHTYGNARGSWSASPGNRVVRL